MASYNSPALKHGAALFLIVTLLTGQVSAFSTGNDFDWIEPLDVENTDFPTDICSNDGDSIGENKYIALNMSNVNANGQIILENKSTSSKTFSTFETLQVKDGAGGYRDNHLYYFGKTTTEIELEEYSSETITIGGNEHTFYVGNVNVDNNYFASAEVNGLQQSQDEPGMIWDSEPEGQKVKVVRTFTDANGNASIEINFYDKVSIPEGKTDYRARFSPDSGSDVVSIPFYANCDSERVPAPKAVSSDSLTVNPFSPYELTTGVQVGSNVVLNLSQKDDDNYNVTIYDGSDTQVGKIVRDGDLLKSGYVLDSAADIFSWQSNEDTLAFSPSSGFLSNDANQYDFYFEIVDNFGTTRYTPEYRVETSGSNDVPVIDSFEAYDGSTWKPVNETTFGSGQVEQVRVSVTDNNNDRHNAYLNLTNEYDQYVKINDSYYSSQGSGTVYTWNLSQIENPDILDSGTWNATVSVSDGISSTTETRTWSYPFNEPNITANYSKTDVDQNNTFEASAVVSCSQYECVNENETIDVYLDPQLENVYMKVGQRLYTYNYESVFSKPKEPALLSLEYWRSWINEVVQ